MIEAYAKTLLKYRWAAIVLSILVTLGLASGGRFLVFTNDYRVFFGPDNPQLIAFDKLQETYTKSDNLFIMLEPNSGTVFDTATMEAIVDITERSWQVPYSIRVDSISNYQHTVSEGDDVFVQDLIEEPQSLEAEAIENIKSVALEQPQLVHKLVSSSGQVTGINITVELPAPLTEEATREMVTGFEADYPEINFQTTGIVAMNQAFPEAIEADAKSLLPMAFLVVIVGVLLFLRNIWSMVGTVLVVLFSILLAMGSAGWLGILLTPPAASAPTVILTLAVADCVHFLVTMLQNMRNKMPKNDAIVESLRVNFTPIFLTSITTAIGFLSMNFSDSPPFHDLGNIVAMGVCYAFLLAVFFLPALMSVLPVKATIRESSWRQKTNSMIFLLTILIDRYPSEWPQTTLQTNYQACTYLNSIWTLAKKVVLATRTF